MPGSRILHRFTRLFPRHASLNRILPSSQTPRVEGLLWRVLDNSDSLFVSPGARLEHLRFILENEPDHAGLRKRWLLNRLPPSADRDALLSLLQQHDQIWDEIPFDASQYLSCWTDSCALPQRLHPWNEDFDDLDSFEQAQAFDFAARNKHLYLLGRNAARNYILANGFHDAPWVFPWDASTFLTASAWEFIRPLLQLPELAYLAIPMGTVPQHADLLVDSDQPPSAFLQPQLGFSRHSQLRFDATLRDGALRDHPLLSQLGVPGPWLHPDSLHPLGDWERSTAVPAPDRGRLLQGGWCYRLPPAPGSDLEESPDDLAVRVIDGIRLLTRRTDMTLLAPFLESGSLRCWTALQADGPALPDLIAIASNARSLEPASPSSDHSDRSGRSTSRYRNAIGHWQHLPGSESALTRDWLAQLSHPTCGDVSELCDRARWQLMVDSVCALTLDGAINANQASLDHAHHLVRAWFLEPTTAMAPDASLARLSAVDVERSSQEAAIDFRDLPVLLDAFSLLRRQGALSLAELQQLDDWLDAFLAWLSTDSSQFLSDDSGRSVSTWYHLLMLAIAAYRGRRNVACQVFDNLPGLLARQFRPDGSPAALGADAPLGHEQLFNLQAWIQLSVISSTLGRDLLALTLNNGFSLPAALEHARGHLPEMGSSPLSGCAPGHWLQAMRVICGLDSQAPPFPPLTDAATGLPPFWNLCRTLPLR